MTMTYRRVVGLAAAGLLAVAPPVFGQRAADVPGLLKQPSVIGALEAARSGEPRTLEDQVRVCEVPAPPFGEAARGDMLRRAFVDLGLQNVRVDRAGNVIGERPGQNVRPRLVVAAHLDTVFPEGTSVKVTRQGNLLRGPGIGDNCRGLAVMLAIVRALNEAGVRTPGSVTFVANVGEEGLGDLRGVKALFGETLKGQVDRFVSIDNAGIHITHNRSRQPPLSGHVQGARRPQLQPVRAAESGQRAGARRREDRRVPVSEQPAHDVQRGTPRRRHVGQRDPVRARGWRSTCGHRMRPRSRSSTPVFRRRWTRRWRKRTRGGAALP